MADNYSEKLKDPRWQKKRLHIFERDRWTCVFCGGSDESLNVHHLCYFPRTEPWEYDEIFLMTLCEPCHESRAVEDGTIRNSYLLRALLLDSKKSLEDLMEDSFNAPLSLRLDGVIAALDNLKGMDRHLMNGG
jgi:hypothetical protein